MLFEPYMHGALSGVDELLNAFDNHLMEQEPDPDTWGTTAQAQEAMRAMEATFGPQATPEPPAEPTIPE